MRGGGQCPYTFLPDVATAQVKVGEAGQVWRRPPTAAAPSSATQLLYRLREVSRVRLGGGRQRLQPTIADVVLAEVQGSEPHR